MKEHIHILQHSLGVDKYGQGNQYRNHFCTGKGSRDFDACRALLSVGLMTERAGSELTGGDSVFHVTPAGIDFVAFNSAKRPTEPKLTRSQKRYRDYLRSGVDCSFAEWMGFVR